MRGASNDGPRAAGPSIQGRGDRAERERPEHGGPEHPSRAEREGVEHLIGRESKPVQIEVEKGAIRRFAEAIGVDDPLHFDEAAARAAGFRSLVAPPTFPLSLRGGGDLRGGLLHSPGKVLLHAEQSFEYARPLVAGDRLTVKSRVVEVAQRATPSGPADVVVIEDEGRDEAGELVYRARAHWVVRSETKLSGAGEVVRE
jgi:acyl dehydratase